MKHAYAVIAGVHIQEVNNATVTKLDCPVLKDGTADTEQGAERPVQLRRYRNGLRQRNERDADPGDGDNQWQMGPLNR